MERVAAELINTQGCNGTANLDETREAVAAAALDMIDEGASVPRDPPPALLQSPGEHLALGRQGAVIAGQGDADGGGVDFIGEGPEPNVEGPALAAGCGNSVGRGRSEHPSSYTGINTASSHVAV